MRIIEEMVSMRDGIRLYTRRVLPEEGKRFPIVFIRTPYDKESVFPCDKKYEDNSYIVNGFAIVYQHVRGTAASEGKCIPYVNERNDGLDMLDYIRSLPEYNGQIYVTGGSYLATVHLAYLDTNPPDIKAVHLSIQTNRMHTRDYSNGICRLRCYYRWVADMIHAKYSTEQRNNLFKKFSENRKIRPFATFYKRSTGEDCPTLSDRLSHSSEKHRVWGKDGICPGIHAMSKLKIPTLLTEGWYDFYLEGMLQMFAEIPEQTKGKCAMIMNGMFGHCSFYDEYNHYPIADPKDGDYSLQWFLHIRDGVEFKLAPEGKMRFYVFGLNKNLISDYPLPEENATATKVPMISKAVTDYTYDPQNPANLYCYTMLDMATLPSRKDVITYYSEKFDKDTLFIGAASLALRVRSDCTDTAFFARISLCDGLGEWNMSDAVCHLRHFVPGYQPGTVADFILPFPISAFEVHVGQKLRVDISSSNDSLFLPHPNTSAGQNLAVYTKVAHNEILSLELTLTERKKEDFTVYYGTI